MKTMRAVLLGASALCAFAPIHALAAEADPQQPAAEQKADGATNLDEIVVTAQRREERLIDVPVSVSVVRGEQAKAAGVVSSRELGFVTPGLVGGQAGYTFQPSIRGMGSTGTTAGDESNVALYVDGVYIAAMGATAFNLANIDHIEVSKGPQGTLFGRNSSGGAIRIVTTKPSFSPEGHIDFNAGFNGAKSREGTVYVTGPIMDSLAMSASLYAYDDDGYLKNADPNYDGRRQGSLRTYMGRIQALYKPNDRLTVSSAVDYSRSLSGVELTTTFIDNINGFKNVQGVIPALRDFEVSTNEQNFIKGMSAGAYVNVEYRLPKYTITSITASRIAHLRTSLDNDRTNLAINRNQYRVDVDTFSQELTFASVYDGPFNFVAGAFFFQSEAAYPYFDTSSATVATIGGVRQVTTPVTLKTRIGGELHTKSYAIFGEGTYHITSKLSLIAGLRYNIDYKHAVNANLLSATAPLVRSHGDWSNVDHRITLNYKPNDDTSIYFTNSTGFKAGYIAIGGYSYPNPQQQVRPENVIGNELGLKTRLWDRIYVSASVFSYDYKDIQLTVNNALSAGAGVVGTSILQNAARAKIQGADLEVSGRLTDHWSANLGVSVLPKAEYSEFTGGIHYEPAPNGLGAIAVASDISGSRILRSPKATENVGVTYQTDLMGGPGGHLRLSGNLYHTSSFYMVVGEGSEQKAYSRLSGEAAWTDPSGRFTVSLWGRNLTNEAYFISGLANTGGFSAVWGKPREIGIGLSAAF